MQAQLKALQAALNQNLVVIQGPPGTGKTFLGVKIVLTLLANGVGERRRFFEGFEDFEEEEDGLVTAGPVLCVCYTNHALDQFLESLVKAGIEDVVRVGGHSKSAVLESKNLHRMPHGAPDHRIGKLTGQMKKLQEELKGMVGNLQQLRARLGWNQLKEVIMVRQPCTPNCILEDDS